MYLSKYPSRSTILQDTSNLHQGRLELVSGSYDIADAEISILPSVASVEVFQGRANVVSQHCPRDYTIPDGFK